MFVNLFGEAYFLPSVSYIFLSKILNSFVNIKVIKVLFLYFENLVKMNLSFIFHHEEPAPRTTTRHPNNPQT